jgi:hypothetical protein
MKRLLLVLLALLPAYVRAQTIQPVIFFRQNVREYLARQWDDTNLYQNERAYCGLYSKFTRDDGGVEYWVETVGPALQDSAQKAQTTPLGINYSCPRSPYTVPIHIHPPATCEQWSEGHWVCYADGAEAYACEPSDVDLAALAEFNAPFAVVQCDRHALVPYLYRPVAAGKRNSVLRPQKKR